MFFTKTVLSALVLTGLVASHGAPLSSLERRFVEAHHLAARDDLATCEDTLSAPDVEEHLLRKRGEFLSKHIGETGFFARMLGKKSKITLRDLDGKVSNGVDAKAVCILTPEVTPGPFYNTDERIRSDISERQAGIPVVYEFKVVNIKNCLPVPNVMVEIWHANATGKYSGEAEEGTVGSHFARGLMATDAKGVIHMKSVFPCWYEFRATHVHVAVHHGGKKVASTGQYEGGRTSHIGQVFFPETLLAKVDKASPYKTSTIARLPNALDDEFKLTNVNGYSAVSSAKYLGSTLGAGIITSITLGVNLQANYTQTLLAGFVMPPV